MAGRKDKGTVDYFPHYCTSGKTVFILESKFSHLGYAIWFKTLELLGSSENHYIDLRNDTDLLFLISKLKTTESELINIYNLLAKLGAIDSYFWSKKIIFSENFIENVKDAYKRRVNLCMHKCDLCMHLKFKCSQNKDKCGHKSTKESKVDNSKGKDKFNFINSFLKIGVEKKIIDDWILVRATKKASNTETSFDDIKEQIKISTLTANECIEIAVKNNWSIFKAEWLNNLKVKTDIAGAENLSKEDKIKKAMEHNIKLNSKK